MRRVPSGARLFRARVNVKRPSAVSVCAPASSFSLKPSLSRLWSQEFVARGQPCRSLQDGLQDTGTQGPAKRHIPHHPNGLPSVVEGPRSPAAREIGKKTRAAPALPRRMGSQGGHREEDTVRVVGGSTGSLAVVSRAL